jgi:tripartite-type tricarboxylate transporter receptor subunit TctC
MGSVPHTSLASGLRLVPLLLLIPLLALSCAEGTGRAGPYPSKTVFLYIFSSQGGGTDQWTRHLASLMEQELGVSMVCANLPGANGGTGAMRVWNAPRDGYAILGASETAMFFGVNAVAPLAAEWEYFIVGGSPGVVVVHADSPHTSVEDLVAAAKRAPRSVTVANSGQGKLWHLKAMQLEQAAGVTFRHIPYNGSGPAITALLSREVQALSCSAGEVAEYVRGGLVRPLLATEAEGVDFENFGAVPSAAALYPESAAGFTDLFQWLGLMLPGDVPPEVLEVLGRAFDNAMAHPKTEELATLRHIRMLGLRGAEAKEVALRMERVASWSSWDLGVARRDPSELGIPRPE